MSFPRYPEYKESGVEWLGEVPAHWQVKQVRHVLRPDSDAIKIGPFGSQLTSDVLVNSGYKVYGQENVISNDFSRGERFIDGDKFLEMHKYAIRPSDILVTMMGTSGRCATVPIDAKAGIMDSHLLRLRFGAETRTDFIALLIDESDYVGHQIRFLGKGSIMHGLNSSIVKQLALALPPPLEQDSILKFLGRETAKVDALIADQQRLIELLTEKRQAVISHAVTKGLNPDTPMKNSGVEWLGEAPAHWEVTRLKFVATVQTGVAKGKDNAGKEMIAVPHLRVANVQDGYFDLADVATIEIPETDLDRYRLRVGDVLMNEGGDYDKLGRGHIWNGEIEPCIHQNHVFAVRPSRVDPGWLNLITSSEYARFYFMSRSKQSTNLASISSSNLLELPVLCPPRTECERILDDVRSQLAGLDELTLSAQKAIRLLQERRAALISAAVTGQIDVRGLVEADDAGKKAEAVSVAARGAMA